MSQPVNEPFSKSVDGIVWEVAEASLDVNKNPEPKMIAQYANTRRKELTFYPLRRPPPPDTTLGATTMIEVAATIIRRSATVTLLPLGT